MIACKLILCAIASASHAPAPADTVALAEVSVTALKQSDKLAGEPMASTVLTADDVAELDIDAVKDLSAVVPNFYIPDYGSRITSTVYVRGLGARIDQPAVGLTIDNVPVINKNAYDIDQPDIAAIEVLRGAQSTLYGRNTMAGQINISTLSPLRFQGWRASFTAGNGGVLKGNAGWYHKFSGNAGLAVVASYNHTDGFFTNSFNGKKVDKEDMWSARAKFDWRVGRSLTLANTLSASGLRQGGYPYESVSSGQIAYNDTCFYRRTLISDGLTLRWIADGFSLTSITSVQHIDDNMTLDQDFLPLDYFTITQRQQETSFTQDVVVRGASGSGCYEWLAGASAFFRHQAMQAPVTFKDAGITGLIEEKVNQINASFPIRWDARRFVLNSDFNLPGRGAAIYHESKVRLGRWMLMAGVRLDYEHAGIEYDSYTATSFTIWNNTGANPEPWGNVPVDIREKGSLCRDFFSALPKAGVVFSLPLESPSNLYANVSKGFKSGGYNTQMFSEVLQQKLMNFMGVGSKFDVDEVVGYKPEITWNFEVGTHLSFFSGKLSADACVFYIDCRDQQLTMFPPGTVTGRMMTNAGKTRSVGVEASCTVDVLRNWHFAASYGFTDARFRDFYNGREQYRGKRLPYVPSNTLFLQAAYTLSVGKKWLKEVSFSADMRGTGSIYWNESNTLRQPFYAVLNASVEFAGPHYALRIFGSNLTDTDYYVFYFMSMGNEFLQRAKPLQFGASLTVDF